MPHRVDRPEDPPPLRPRETSGARAQRPSLIDLEAKLAMQVADAKVAVRRAGRPHAGLMEDLGGLPILEEAALEGPVRSLWVLLALLAVLGLWGLGRPGDTPPEGPVTIERLQERAQREAPPRRYEALALMPARPLRGAGSTLVTHALVSASLASLLASSFLLWLFGRDAERALGELRWLALVAGGVLAGAVAVVVLGPRDVLVAGPGAGAAAVSAWFAVRFPEPRLILQIGPAARRSLVVVRPVWLIVLWIVPLAGWALLDTSSRASLLQVLAGLAVGGSIAMYSRPPREVERPLRRRRRAR